MLNDDLRNWIILNLDNFKFHTLDNGANIHGWQQYGFFFHGIIMGVGPIINGWQKYGSCN
jgi:hypothetical protein